MLKGHHSKSEHSAEQAIQILFYYLKKYRFKFYLCNCILCDQLLFCFLDLSLGCISMRQCHFVLMIPKHRLTLIYWELMKFKSLLIMSQALVLQIGVMLSFYLHIMGHNCIVIIFWRCVKFTNPASTHQPNHSPPQKMQLFSFPTVTPTNNKNDQLLSLLGRLTCWPNNPAQPHFTDSEILFLSGFSLILYPFQFPTMVLFFVAHSWLVFT